LRGFGGRAGSVDVRAAVVDPAATVDFVVVVVCAGDVVDFVPPQPARAIAIATTSDASPFAVPGRAKRVMCEYLV
jgi:hypothetical protein